jgi:hypothetical protein
MSYKIDDRLICFTLEGIILANNQCNSVKLNTKYYIDLHHGVLSESDITTKINRRRCFNNDVFRAVNERVMARFMQQDMSDQ